MADLGNETIFMLIVYKKPQREQARKWRMYYSHPNNDISVISDQEEDENGKSITESEKTSVEHSAAPTFQA